MIRQRISHSMPSSEDAIESSAANSVESGKVPVMVKGTRMRPKRLIGRIVPLILLTYVYFAYDLVVVEYGYKHLIQSKRHVSSTYIYIFLAHLLFFISLINYFRIFLSTTNEDPQASSKLKAFIPTSPFDPPLALLESKSILFQTSSNGEPIRCFRDSCNGKWKPPRSRHCGDCRKCIPSFDHHCPWFDSDISSPRTMLPFLIFLSFVLILWLWCFIPLLPMAARHSYAIWNFGKQDARVRKIWWDKKSTWIGGPFFRWIVGWIVAGKSIPVDRSDPLDSFIISSPNLKLPLVVFSGLMLILVAGALLGATLIQIKNGDLSVDVERRKAFSRIAFKNPHLANSIFSSSRNADQDLNYSLDPKETEIRDQLRKLSPILYFRVNFEEDGERDNIIVPISEHENPYDLGWKNNFRVFLGLKPSLQSGSGEQEILMSQHHLYWPINPDVEKRLRIRAEEVRKGRRAQ